MIRRFVLPSRIGFLGADHLARSIGRYGTVAASFRFRVFPFCWLACVVHLQFAKPSQWSDIQRLRLDDICKPDRGCSVVCTVLQVADKHRQSSKTDGKFRKRSVSTSGVARHKTIQRYKDEQPILSEYRTILWSLAHIRSRKMIPRLAYPKSTKTLNLCITDRGLPPATASVDGVARQTLPLSPGSSDHDHGFAVHQKC